MRGGGTILSLILIMNNGCCVSSVFFRVYVGAPISLWKYRVLVRQSPCASLTVVMPLSLEQFWKVSLEPVGSWSAALENEDRIVDLVAHITLKCTGNK